MSCPSSVKAPFITTPSPPHTVAVLPAVILLSLRGQLTHIGSSTSRFPSRFGSAALALLPTRGVKVLFLFGLLSGFRQANISDSGLLQAPDKIDFAWHARDFGGNLTGGFVLENGRRGNFSSMVSKLYI